MRSRFDTLHERAFGHKAETQTVAVPKPKLKAYPGAKTSADEALKGQRQVYFGRDAVSIDYTIYDREHLHPGHKLTGPAIVEQMDSTTAIYPGDGRHRLLSEHHYLGFGGLAPCLSLIPSPFR